MGYKSMTVLLDNSAGSSRRLAYALALAAAHDAHLMGLHLTYSPVLISDPYAAWAPILAEWEQSAEEKHEQARLNFYAAADKAGVKVDWAGYRSDDMQDVIAHARASDLTVIGQRNPDDAEGDFGGGFPENIVLRLGRPVLFLPYIGEMPTSFEKVIVAWDGGREAARAMADALPFLKLAKQVRLMSVSEKKDKDHDLPDIDIAGYLAKHGVKLEVEKNENVKISAADCLLSAAADMGADLLVMGGYGHHRLTELIFGGVTNSIMRHMTLPVLMSH
ncbi:universal stress protein [Undibacterium piscinae]|jgi:nucleotide-binding universal stress UspA family protein|uniref:Universal stress protein n=1 Tax=Undibacterium piscinae TaxID=2495591 RepID=A0A6M4A192_9BURK|nr:universal stress protein [Undibacterium piscinae]